MFTQHATRERHAVNNDTHRAKRRASAWERPPFTSDKNHTTRRRNRSISGVLGYYYNLHNSIDKTPKHSFKCFRKRYDYPVGCGEFSWMSLRTVINGHRCGINNMNQTHNLSIPATKTRKSNYKRMATCSRARISLTICPTNGTIVSPFSCCNPAPLPTYDDARPSGDDVHNFPQRARPRPQRD